MNKKRVKKKWGDKGRECFMEVEDCSSAIRCTGGKASRRRGSFVACGKLSLKDEEGGGGGKK